MHVLMVTDAYPPLRTSCAVQMYDLGQAFIEQGHQVSIITPSYGLQEKIKIELRDGVRLVQVRAFQTKDINYVYRTFAEFINPFLIWSRLKKNPEFLNTRYDGIVWYSPTIFWGPLIKRLKQHYHVKAYLILRDIFPDWALDLGLIKKGLVYKFLKSVEYFQYQQADVIGVQSPNNLKYFKENNPGNESHIEVVWNWIGGAKREPCSINLSNTPLAGRKICVYAGNMGMAQSIDDLIKVVETMQPRKDVGFLFIGRGTAVDKLRHVIRQKGLDNAILLEEIPSNELIDLYGQCSIGLLSLNARHNSHNIPGKFLSYLQAGIPTLGIVNPGNDLLELNDQYKLGKFYLSADSLIDDLIKNEEFIENLKLNFSLEDRNYLLSSNFCPIFSVKKIVKGININEKMC